MIQSTWGNWFVESEIEQAIDADMSIWYLGGNGFVLRTVSTTIYIDPFFGNGEPPTFIRMDPVPMDPADATMCDAVLITHEHFDHMHPQSFHPLVAELGADLFAPQTAYEHGHSAESMAPDDAHYHTVSVDDTFTVGDCRIHVCAANDPDAIEPVSYVIEHPAGVFFHGGDTRPASAFRSIGERFDIDIGVLAFGSDGRRYYPDPGETRERHVYMDQNEIIQAANQLQLSRLIPSHYRLWKGLDANPVTLFDHATSYTYPHTIEPMKVGDRICVGRPGIVPLDVLE